VSESGERSRTFRLRALALLAALLPLLPTTAQAFGLKEFYADSGALELLGGANRISLSPGFNYGLFEWLQVGGQLSYQTVGFGDDSVNTTTIRLGPTIDFGGAYPLATFAFVGYAIRKGNGTVASPADDPAGSGLCLLVGRRIPLSSRFSWRPSAGIQMAGKMTFVVNALSASYFF
jgi:hypothetical protein